MNRPVSFPIAKLLKEKGYEGQTHVDHRYDPLYYHKSGELHLYNWFNSFDNMIKAPTIADVVMWLYEKYGVWVEVYNDNSKKEFYTVLNGEEYKFKSPTKAYEVAIEYCLKNLI